VTHLREVSTGLLKNIVARPSDAVLQLRTSINVHLSLIFCQVLTTEG